MNYREVDNFILLLLSRLMNIQDKLEKSEKVNDDIYKLVIKSIDEIFEFRKGLTYYTE